MSPFLPSLSFSVVAFPFRYTQLSLSELFLQLTETENSNSSSCTYQVTLLPILGHLTKSYSLTNSVNLNSSLALQSNLYYYPLNSSAPGSVDIMNYRIIDNNSFASSVATISIIIGTPRVSNSLVFNYAFADGQLNNTALFSSDQSGMNVLGSLIFSSSSTQWLSGRSGLYVTGINPVVNGTAFVGITSAKNVTILKTILNATNEFTMEVWLQPSSTIVSGMIVGLGEFTPASSNQFCVVNSATTQSITLFQNLAQTMWQIALNPCENEGPSTLNTSLAYQHLVMTARFDVSTHLTTRTVYYNGQTAYSRSDSFALTYDQWSSSNRLQIAASKLLLGNGSWSGSIYQLVMYSVALRSSQVYSNYIYGIPNSAPILSMKYSLQSLNPVFSVSSNVNGTLLSMLVLNATDFDNNSVSILITTIPSSGNLFVFYPDLAIRVYLNTSTLPYEIPLPTSAIIGFSSSAGTASGNVYFTYAAYDGIMYGAVVNVTLNIVQSTVAPIATSPPATTVIIGENGVYSALGC